MDVNECATGGDLGPNVCGIRDGNQASCTNTEGEITDLYLAGVKPIIIFNIEY